MFGRQGDYKDGEARAPEWCRARRRDDGVRRRRAHRQASRFGLTNGQDEADGPDGLDGWIGPDEADGSNGSSGWNGPDGLQSGGPAAHYEMPCTEPSVAPCMLEPMAVDAATNSGAAGETNATSDHCQWSAERLDAVAASLYGELRGAVQHVVVSGLPVPPPQLHHLYTCVCAVQPPYVAAVAAHGGYHELAALLAAFQSEVSVPVPDGAVIQTLQAVLRTLTAMLDAIDMDRTATESTVSEDTMRHLLYLHNIVPLRHDSLEAVAVAVRCRLAAFCQVDCAAVASCIQRDLYQSTADVVTCGLVLESLLDTDDPMVNPVAATAVADTAGLDFMHVCWRVWPSLDVDSLVSVMLTLRMVARYVGVRQATVMAALPLSILSAPAATVVTDGALELLYAALSADGRFDTPGPPVPPPVPPPVSPPVPPVDNAGALAVFAAPSDTVFHSESDSMAWDTCAALQQTAGLDDAAYDVALAEMAPDAEREPVALHLAQSPSEELRPHVWLPQVLRYARTEDGGVAADAIVSGVLRVTRAVLQASPDLARHLVFAQGLATQVNSVLEPVVCMGPRVQGETLRLFSVMIGALMPEEVDQVCCQMAVWPLLGRCAQDMARRLRHPAGPERLHAGHLDDLCSVLERVGLACSKSNEVRDLVQCLDDVLPRLTESARRAAQRLAILYYYVV